MADASEGDREKRVREAGLRRTAARVAVLKELEASGTPMTHGEVVEALHGCGFDQSTVYRNLIDLAEAGLVRRMEVGDHVWRFELIRANGRAVDEHAHFLCVECGRVRCVPEVRLDETCRNTLAAFGSVTEVLIKGRCAVCEMPALCGSAASDGSARI